MLDAMTEAPAGILNHRMDILAANRLGRALFSHALSGSGNLARFAFLDARARDLYVDWDGAADDSVAILRTATGSNPHDPELSALVGSSPRTARISAPGGRHTKSGSTAAAPSNCAIQWPVFSTCRSRPWNSPRTQTSRSWPTRPPPARPPRTPCACSPAGP
ncbi:hypothetical protein KUF83_39825 [Streptomyces sp. BV286]|nr:hypothetical protein [Streptomyces sp. BV286]